MHRYMKQLTIDDDDDDDPAHLLLSLDDVKVSWRSKYWYVQGHFWGYARVDIMLNYHLQKLRQSLVAHASIQQSLAEIAEQVNLPLVSNFRCLVMVNHLKNFVIVIHT